MGSIVGKLYQRVSLFAVVLILAVTGLGVLIPQYFNQVAHATAPILTLTAPAATTITRSALVPETSGGTPTGGNTVVNTAINGLNVIPVTLANTGDAASANVRISPIGADSHIQLWAKDTSDNWFDINVTGWIGSAGKSILAGSSITTSVYAISDTTGDYPLTVNLVNVSDSSSAAAPATGTVTVTPIIHTQADFTAFDGVNIGTNFYTPSSHITATYTTGAGTESNPVLLKLTGYAPIVTPWFGKDWTTYNYVTVGIQLPAGFTGAYVYQTGIMRYDENPAGAYKMSSVGNGSTPLATAGAAKGFLDYSFAANSENTKKGGLVKLQVIWNANSAPEYFTIDINNLSLTDKTAPTVPVLTSPINGVFINNNAPLMQWDNSTDIGGSGVAGYEYQVYYNCSDSSNIPSSCSSSYTHPSLIINSELQGGATPDGTYYWRVRAKDNTENFSGWSNFEKVTIDTVLPAMPTGLKFQNTARTQDFACGAVIQLQPVTPDWNDIIGDPSFSHYEYTSFLPDGSIGLDEHVLTASEFPNTWMPPTDGAYGYAVRTVDKAGNKSEWALSAKTLAGSCQIVYDTIAPTITVNNFITNDSTPKLTGTVNDNTAAISIKIGTSIFTATNNGNGTWELADNAITPALADNTYDVIASATDTAGNIGVDSSTNELTIDTIAPTATHKYYKNGIEVTGLVYAQNLSDLTFDSTVTDAIPSSGLKYETFSIFEANGDGSFGWDKAYCGFRQPANTYSLDGSTKTITGKNLTDCVSSLPDGEYYVMHGEYDNAARGNDTAVTQYRDSLGLHFVIDNTAPIITYSGFSKTNNSYTPAITVSGYDSFSWVADPNNLAGATFNSALLSPTFTVTNSGNYSFVLTAVDELGNKSSFDYTFSYMAPVTERLAAPIITPLATINQGTNAGTGEVVLGEQTTQPPASVNTDNTNSDTGVAGVTDSKDNSAWKIFGLAWYWWLAILAALAAGWWAITAYRHRGEEV